MNVSSDNASPTEDELPVTVVVTRKVKPGHEKDYERFLSDVSKVAHRYEGHLGVNVLHEPGSREYTLVFRFDTVKNLRRWEESAERAEWVARGEALAEAPAQVDLDDGERGEPAHDRHLVLLMTYVVMPRLTQAFASWLYPKGASRRS